MGMNEAEDMRAVDGRALRRQGEGWAAASSDSEELLTLSTPVGAHVPRLALRFSDLQHSGEDRATVVLLFHGPKHSNNMFIKKKNKAYQTPHVIF